QATAALWFCDRTRDAPARADRPPQGPLHLAAARGRLDPPSRFSRARRRDLPAALARAQDHARGIGMSARDAVLASIRRSLGVTGTEAPRRREVADRIAGRPRGIIPTRGQGSPQERVDLFARMVELAAGSVARVNDATDIPTEVADFLRKFNLPTAVQRG